ncbi:unnamed protein product [Sphagnum balticum]
MGDAIDKWVKVGTTKPDNLHAELQGFLKGSQNDQGSALAEDRRRSVILRMAEAETIIEEVKTRALPTEAYNEAAQDLSLSQKNLSQIQQSEPNADMREIVQRQYDDTQALRNSSDGFGATGLINGLANGRDSGKP